MGKDDQTGYLGQKYYVSYISYLATKILPVINQFDRFQAEQRSVFACKPGPSAILK
jgi:hypothetical protein